MNKYEAMFIVKPDLSEQDRKALFGQIHEVISKNNGSVTSGSVWAEKRKLHFRIKKYEEGLYYLLSFMIAPLAIKEIRHAYNLNENILRVMISNLNT